ncbi:MAG TPA: hypothetical protein VM370_12930, partial [Candidatus Thermoplasmatota archaeon]|nr:hypothetical protein [Candidatus Thermoplasmatota archaeon]
PCPKRRVARTWSRKRSYPPTRVLTGVGLGIPRSITLDRARPRGPAKAGGTLLTPIRVLALVALLVASLVLPSAAAKEAEETTTDVTFYGHIFTTGRGSPMPMNTQFPAGEADLSQGIVGHTCGLSPAPIDTPVGSTGEDCEADPANEAWLYTTAGFVQIKNQNEFDYSKLHNERGLTKDTSLDTGRDITATFYMSADAHGWPIAACQPGMPHDVPWPVPCWNWDPGYLSQWQVEATVYTGILGDYGGAADTQPDIGAAFDAGKLVPLATGVSKPQDVQSLEATGNPTVWKFDINLGKPVRDVIKKEESYVVRFQWWSVKPDGSHRVLPEVDVWNVNSGQFFPPTIVLPVKGAFNVEMVVPQFVYGKLVILGIMNTPWGSYDVDQDSIQLTITNAKTGATFEPKAIERLADFSVAHGGHYKPVNVTYVWDFAADKLPPGDYDVTVTASNYQGSASSACTGSFTLLSGGNAGAVKAGECGVRTISDDQLNNVKTGSAKDAGGSESATPLPLPQVGLFAAPLALVFARRWRP